LADRCDDKGPGSADRPSAAIMVNCGSTLIVHRRETMIV
jgi:hypothetical protein